MQIAGCSIRKGNPGFLDWLFEHTPFRIFCRSRGKKGVTRTIRETIGNCTIVHREMTVEFRESTRSERDRDFQTSSEHNISTCFSLALRSLTEVTYLSLFYFFQLNRAIKGQRRITAYISARDARSGPRELRKMCKNAKSLLTLRVCD